MSINSAVSARATKQARDGNGRFTKAGMPEPPPILPPKKNISAKTQSPPPKHDNRLDVKPEPPPILPPKKILPLPENSDRPEPEQESEAKKSKKKGAPAKSPYFTTATPKKSRSKTLKSEGDSSKAPQTPRKSTESSPSPKKSRTPTGLSCIPFPPLSSPTFGLIQEKLASDPFRLLIAVTFLIRTHGKHAIPVFYTLISKYPTPESLAEAEVDDFVDIIRHLGLQNQRAATYQAYARIWLDDPPVRGKRFAVKGYPNKESGRNISKDTILADDDEGDGWEIGHMTQGPYALDSWRIFCRDKLRGVAEGWNGEGAQAGFQPEWMRVVPEDKELRAFLRWMWLKEGFEWDPFTGEKEVAGRALVRAAMEGMVVWDERGGMRVLDQV